MKTYILPFLACVAMAVYLATNQQPTPTPAPRPTPPATRFGNIFRSGSSANLVSEPEIDAMLFALSCGEKKLYGLKQPQTNR